MKLPSFRRLNKQDFSKENQELIEKLAGNLNIGIETLYDVLNKRLNLDDNFLASVRTFQVQTNNNGIPVNSTSFNIDKIGTIKGLSVLNVINLTNPNVYPTSGVTISFEQRTQNILIKHITGLPVGNLFSITVVAFG